MSTKRLLYVAEQIILSVGDVILDLEANQVGVLIRRHKHIVLEYDEVYVWDIYWGNPEAVGKHKFYMNLDYIEEDFLKFSIAAGIFDHYSEGGKSEP
tara:strand:- start:1454 stop:1744 length:291 start_codon:yes stop_codon:yes gene_type:complete